MWKINNPLNQKNFSINKNIRTEYAYKDFMKDKFILRSNIWGK